MFDNLETLFFDNVLQGYDAYAVTRDSDSSGRHIHMRAAIVAAEALFHFREHFTTPKTRTQVETGCPHYRLIADVVNATKHKQITRPTPTGPSLVNSAEDIEEVTIVTRFEDEEGPYADGKTRIFVNCTDNVRRSLDEALTNVLNYWAQEVERLGVTPVIHRKLPEVAGSRLLNRNEVRSPNFAATQGLDFKKTLQLLQFDPARGLATPVDLTGSNIVMRVYKPAYSVDVAVSARGEVQPVKFSVDLTEDQSAEFAGLKTEAERQSFIRSMFEAHRDEFGQKVSQELAARKKDEAPK